MPRQCQGFGASCHGRSRPSTGVSRPLVGCTNAPSWPLRRGGRTHVLAIEAEAVVEAAQFPHRVGQNDRSATGFVRSLSVCCLVADPAERVGAILETVRAAADEVVVAVDAATPAAESTQLAALADRLVRVEYVPPFERYLAWLHSLCRGEWIFGLDGDEFPSASLIEALPPLPPIAA